MNESFEGIVLQKYDSGENDLVLHVLCPSLGKLSLIIRHAKKTRKSFGAKLDLFDRGRFSVRHKGSSLPVLSSFEPFPSFRNLRGDIDKLILASSLAEIVDGLVKESSWDNNVTYDALYLGLKAVDEAEDLAGALKASFLSLSHILREAGISDVASHERPSVNAYLKLLGYAENFLERRLKTRDPVNGILQRFRSEQANKV